MANKTVVATGEVTITLKLPDLGSWGDECTVEQILRQASEAAKTRAHKCLSPGTQASIKVENIIIREQ